MAKTQARAESTCKKKIQDRSKTVSKGQSKSNGEVERAVQEVQGIARTLKDSVEQKSGLKQLSVAWRGCSSARGLQDPHAPVCNLASAWCTFV